MSSLDDEHIDAFGTGPQSDGRSSNGSTLVLSLYLIHSEDDLFHLTQGDIDVKKRARLYTRLCQACAIANNILRRSSSSLSKDNGKRYDTATKYYPWSSGGDGPIFGVHCDVHSDEYFTNYTNGIDGDNLWQSQSLTQSGENSMNDNINADRKVETKGNPIQHQPHLRATCRYNNDVNDMWRCVSLALQISSTLSKNNLSCAIECWDMTDGHILLIEAAEHLPAWVDDDALQGGVGGPKGCRNRCWIVNGMINLIPPSKEQVTLDMSQSGSSSSSSLVESAKELSRNDALSILMKSIQRNSEKSLVLRPDAVQRVIQYRINRTDYSCTKVPKHSSPEGNTASPHWHTTVAALPASVARFIQIHPYLVPFLVDSFCECAPAYLKDTRSCKRETRTSGDAVSTANDGDSNKSPIDKNNCHQPTTKMAHNSFGSIFPYEEIVLFPIIFTRTNYAELVTGRGIVPTFPVPPAYRSVELNRFQRQLHQSAFGCDNLLADEDGAKSPARNPFNKAVDVGIRLCAGLDWILTKSVGQTSSHFLNDDEMELEDPAIDTLGEVERRLRIYWTMIDAEATGKCDQLPWIEHAWRGGPNGSKTQGIECDETLIEAIESMVKCNVFNPELCKPLWKEPCPYTRPGMTVLEMAQSGINDALNWQRRECSKDAFPFPRVWELDDDSWMVVDSLEELEDEMKSISNREVNTDSQRSSEKRPRRTTRRSRRNLAQARGEQSDVRDEQQLDDAKSATKMLAGIRSFVEGEGDLEGAVTNNVAKSPNQPDISIQNDIATESGIYRDVNINPRRFLNILHSMLSSDQCKSSLGITNDCNVVNDGNDELAIDDNISKYFFQEDLDTGDISGDSDCDSDESIFDCEKDNRELQLSADQDPWSLQNIMVCVHR
jgi:hypothetical protein